MSRSLVALLEEKALVVPVTATRPTTVAHGVDVTSWRTGGSFSNVGAIAFYDANADTEIGSPTGGTAGVELWGYRLGQWWRVGILNGGDEIVIIGAGQGEAQELNTLGVFERLAIAGTPSGGATATARLIPTESLT